MHSSHGVSVDSNSVNTHSSVLVCWRTVIWCFSCWALKQTSLTSSSLQLLVTVVTEIRFVPVWFDKQTCQKRNREPAPFPAPAQPRDQGRCRRTVNAKEGANAMCSHSRHVEEMLNGSFLTVGTHFSSIIISWRIVVSFCFISDTG